MSRFRVSDPTKARHYMAFSGLGLAASLAIACGSGGEKPAASNAAPALIRLDGSRTVFPISEAVAEEVQKANHDVRVNVGISGTGGLSRPLFIYVARKSADRPEVQRFVDAYFSASALTREVGYVELTPQINDLAKKHFADRKVGTAFGAGGSQVGLTLEQLLTREQ